MQPPRFLAARLDAKGELTTGIAQPPVPWWSFTKTLLATAVLLLIEQGHLNLDRPLPGHPFTLRQLLQHRSGLPDYGGIPDYQQAARRGDEPWSAEQLLQRANATTLVFEPGQGWCYSNIGYVLVRQFIEQTTGRDLQTALKSLIFNRLGMHSVHLARTPEDLAITAWGNAGKYHPGWVYHGLLIGTPADAARFLHLLIRGEILPRDLRTQMLDRHLVEGVSPGRPWTTTGYGLGLMLGHTQSAGFAIGHSGAGPGSSAAIYHFPDPAPRTAAIFAQTGDPGPAEFEAARQET